MKRSRFTDEQIIGILKSRKRALGSRTPILAAQGINDRWSLDFVHDQLTDGPRFRFLAGVDDATRECLGLVADTSISGARVARELDRIVVARGKPRSNADRRRELFKKSKEPVTAGVACELGNLRKIRGQVVGQQAVPEFGLCLGDNLVRLRKLLDIVDPCLDWVVISPRGADLEHVEDDLRILRIVLIPSIV